MFDIHLYSDYLIKLGQTRTGRSLYRLMVGIVGVLILTGFFSALMAPRAVANLFPVILGFNTALTGYSLIESTRDGFRHKRLVAVAAGVLVVLVATASVNLLFWKLAGPNPGGLDSGGWGLIGMDRLWVLLAVGIVTSWLGGALAVKFINLNRIADPERRP
jgi:hypothetical protein